jgi:hypothetical protein
MERARRRRRGGRAKFSRGGSDAVAEVRLECGRLADERPGVDGSAAVAERLDKAVTPIGKL